MATSFELTRETSPDAYELETYGELRPAVNREWLLTNGLGGYASGTVADVSTRRYHATLAATNRPPAARVMALSRWGCRLSFDDQSHDLWGGYFRYGLSGDGPTRLRRFRLADDVAEWEFDASGVKVFKQVFVCWHRNVTGVRFLVRPPSDRPELATRLELSPFTGLRDLHELQRSGQLGVGVSRDESGDLRIETDAIDVRLRAHDAHDEALPFEEEPDWWYGQTYPMEAKRGNDDREDLFTPGRYVAETSGEGAVTLWASLGAMPKLDWSTELARRAEASNGRTLPTVPQRRLARAAADFVVRRRRPDGAPGTTIMAGYPWLRDWGRDTFIALPGLLLSTGRHLVAGQVLSTFAAFVSEGMIPSDFDRQTGQPNYNTVDTSLWFIDASFKYLRATGDRDVFDAVLEPTCHAIVEGYTNGTRDSIGVDPADGLVHAGTPTTRLTWMDGDLDGLPVTPRNGKPVEINALWYHALCLLKDDRAEDVKRSFVEAYVLPDGRGLADVVRESPGRYERDETLRPNQIFAVSLQHSPLELDDQRTVVDVVRRNLLTPHGLRTLAPSEREYVSRFTGTRNDRHRAGHQGSVWPWLIGPFLDAHLKTTGRQPASVRRARTWLRPLLQDLERGGCIGSLPELLDAEHPYRPGGCFAQAWSVAEVLRLAVELEL